MKGNCFIGTSGFSYPDWIRKFYPEDLPSNQWLEFYSQNFSALELNNTFYRIPQEKTFANWYKRTPKNFLFSVKANQRITHLKRLKIEAEDWQFFWQRVSFLKEKLAVILFQLPPNLKKDTDRLAEFLEKYKTPTRFAFEFRNESWFDKEIYQILKAYQSSLVFHDAQVYPQPPFEITADFVYLRFHGAEVLYNYEYSEEQLNQWAKKIKRWLAIGLDIFAFFNNDPGAAAIANARQLSLLQENNARK